MTESFMRPPCPCGACSAQLDAPCTYGDPDPEGVELQALARGVYNVFAWGCAIAFTSGLAIAYLLATL